MGTQQPEQPLPIIGREYFLINKLTKILHKEAKRHYDYGQINEIPRGHWFEVKMTDDGRWIARVEVTLSRVEPQKMPKDVT